MTDDCKGMKSEEGMIHHPKRKHPFTDDNNEEDVAEEDSCRRNNSSAKSEKKQRLLVPTTTTPTTDNNAEAVREASSEAMASQCHTSTLFIGGLHPRVADVHLQKLFQPYGPIQRVYVARHNSNNNSNNNNNGSNSKGYGFVEYRSIDSAKHAICRVNGRSLLGKVLSVRPAHEKSMMMSSKQREGHIEDNPSTSTTSKKNDLQSVIREKSIVESKIAAVRRAIQQKQQTGG